MQLHFSVCLCFRLRPYISICSSISVFASFCFRLRPYMQLHFSVCLFLFQTTTLYAAQFQCLPLSVSDYDPTCSSISVFASVSDYGLTCSSISVFASFCFRLRPYMQLSFSVCLFLFQTTTLHAAPFQCLPLFQITALHAAPFQCLPLSVSDYNPICSSVSVPLVLTQGWAPCNQAQRLHKRTTAAAGDNWLEGSVKICLPHSQCAVHNRITLFYWA